MPRFRGMIRGFSILVASSGYGVGADAISVRFVPREGRTEELEHPLVRDIVPATARRRGMALVHLFRPSAPPPVTKEQSMRG